MAEQIRMDGVYYLRRDTDGGKPRSGAEPARILAVDLDSHSPVAVWHQGGFSQRLSNGMVGGGPFAEDLVPAPPEPALVPWSGPEEFLAAGAWGAAFREIGLAATIQGVQWADNVGVYLDSDGNQSWQTLADVWECFINGEWHPCGKVVTP